MSCLSRGSLWRRFWRNIVTDIRALVLGALGVTLSVIGLFIPGESRALALLASGVSVIVLAVLLSSIKEGEIGPKGLKFKRELASRDATFQPILAEVERREFLRFVTLLSGNPDRAERFLEQSVFRAYAHWHQVPSHARRPVLFCHLIESVGGAQTLGVNGRSEARLGGSTDAWTQDEEELVTALSSLALQLRAALLMRHFAGLDDREMALALSVSVEQARAYLQSAEKLFAQQQVAREGAPHRE